MNNNFTTEQTQYIIFTDGSCYNKTTLSGGFAGIIINRLNNTCNEFACYNKGPTTNNRMELLSVLTALQQIPYKSYVQLFTDSTYVSDAINKGWLFQWKSTNFRRRKNADLWHIFYNLLRKIHLQIFWIKGHSGHPLNERCNYLAQRTANNLFNNLAKNVSINDYITNYLYC